MGPGGIIEGAHAGLVVIDMSTITPVVASTLAARLAEYGITLLDAPVGGGDAGAMAGTLSIMVGGDEETFKRCMPIFQALGKTIVHVGASGAGQDHSAPADLSWTSLPIVLGSLEVQDDRRGKQVCFDHVGPDYCEFETACKRSGCRRDGQVWHQTCPGFGHLDAYPAQDGQRDKKGPGTCISTLEFRVP